jgi:RimJ/RimL family protein N-acetyltransferase
MIRLDSVYSEKRQGSISEATLRFLYELLGAREPHVNISHRKMPTFQQHKDFVESCPYRNWWLIVMEHAEGARPIGSCYLTDIGEIGIHIADGHRGKGVGTEVIELIKEMYPGERLLANIAPGNEASMWLFTRRGFKLIQHTLALEP